MKDSKNTCKLNIFESKEMNIPLKSMTRWKKIFIQKWKKPLCPKTNQNKLKNNNKKNKII